MDRPSKSIPASIVLHRKAFHYATRTWDESIETWYKRLKSLAAPCSFGDAHDLFLLNKFVVDLKEDNSDQINGINMINNEWNFQLIESLFNKEPNNIYFEELVIQVKDEIDNDRDCAGYRDDDFSDNGWNTIHCTQPITTAAHKKRYKKRDLNVAHAARVDVQVEIIEDPEVSIETPTTAQPKPKKRQFRKPLKLFCESCPGRNFKCKSNLLQHMQRYHIKSKSHVCHYCGKSFNVSMELNKHIRTHTGERPFPCDMCPKRFARSDKLKQHRDVHFGIKPHVCGICNKKYSQAYSLTIHFRSHTGERPYKCKFCEKAYTNAKSLTIHLKTHGIAN